MKVRCFHSFAEAAQWAADINALNLASASPDPFSTFEFYNNIVANDPAFSNGETGTRLWLLAAFVEDRLVGYLALKEVSSWCLWRRSAKLDFLVSHETDRPRAVSRPGDAALVTAAFYRFLYGHKNWDVIELQQQSTQSTLFPPPDEVSSGRYRIKRWPTMQNHTLPIRWNSLSEYFGALSQKFRGETRRQLRKLFAAGELALVTSDNSECTPELLNLYCAIEAHSWKTRAKLGVSSDPVREATLRGLLTPGQPMRIVIQILLLNGAPVAGLISCAFDSPATKGFYLLHIVFDDRFAELAPGSAMLMLGIKYAIDRRYGFANLLSGFGYYKSRWLAQATATHSGQIYRIGSPPYWRRVAGDLKRWILRRPIVEQGIEFRDGATQGWNASRRTGASGTAQTPVSLDTLVQYARRGVCEYLSADDLAAAMPFELESQVRSPAPSTKKRKRRAQTTSEATC